jgi:hypothetical protein
MDGDLTGTARVIGVAHHQHRIGGLPSQRRREPLNPLRSRSAKSRLPRRI